jgi:hypothetical protein
MSARYMIFGSGIGHPAWMQITQVAEECPMKEPYVNLHINGMKYIFFTHDRNI